MDFLELPDAFSDREFNWSENAQGLATGAGYWFATQKVGVWRLPDTKPIGSDFSDFHEIPKPLRDHGYDHFGDPDVFGGRLFIPLEGKDIATPHAPLLQPQAIRPRLCAYDASTMTFLGWASFPEQPTNAPWLAVHPVSGLLYSSHDHPDYIVGHKVRADPSVVSLQAVEKLSLRKENGELNSPGQVQGGAFTPDGKFLFLSVKYDNRLELQCYSFPECKRVRRKFITTDGVLNDIENEGVMIVRTATTPVHRKLTLYYLVLNNDVGQDNVSLKRFEIHE